MDGMIHWRYDYLIANIMLFAYLIYLKHDSDSPENVSSVQLAAWKTSTNAKVCSDIGSTDEEIGRERLCRDTCWRCLHRNLRLQQVLGYSRFGSQHGNREKFCGSSTQNSTGYIHRIMILVSFKMIITGFGKCAHV